MNANNFSKLVSASIVPLFRVRRSSGNYAELTKASEYTMASRGVCSNSIGSKLMPVDTTPVGPGCEVPGKSMQDLAERLLEQNQAEAEAIVNAPPVEVVVEKVESPFMKHIESVNEVVEEVLFAYLRVESQWPTMFIRVVNQAYELHKLYCAYTGNKPKFKRSDQYGTISRVWP